MNGVGAERRHHLLLLFAVEPSVNKANAEGSESLLQAVKFLGDRLDPNLAGVFDTRIDDVCLAALGKLVADECPDLGEPVGGTHERVHAAPSRRRLVNDRHVQVAIKREAERARDGGGGHHQQMRVAAFADELFALGDAELVLLVNDDETEVRQFESFCEQGVGANVEGGALRVLCFVLCDG